VTRQRPIVRVRCTACGLRLVVERHPDGRLFVTRHPERVHGPEHPATCAACAERLDRPAARL